MVFITLLQALWASSIPMSKIMLTMSPPIFLAGVRMVGAGIILLMYQYFTRSFSVKNFEYAHAIYYVQIIFFGVYVKYILRYWGLSHLSTTKMSFMLNLTPFFVALFSYIFFKELLSRKQWLGLCIGFIGLVPILLINAPTEPARELFLFSWAELAIIAEIAAHSYALIVARKMIRDLGCSPALTNGIRMFGGGALALGTSLLLETAPVTEPLHFGGWIMVLILLSNIICHNFYLYLLKYYSATFLSLSDFLSPLFVACYGWLFLHEAITWHYYCSASIVLVGLYLFYQDEVGQEFAVPWLRSSNSEVVIES